MTTLNPPEHISQKEDFAVLPLLPRDEDGPVFAEPWEAQAFALAVKLSDQGHFTWKEWADTLAQEIKPASDRGEYDDGSHYYYYWLTALERLISAKGLSNSDEMLARKEAWADAYRHTPHGKPVDLAPAGNENTRNEKNL
jgi:nitrile hydratase accessory protein